MSRKTALSLSAFWILVFAATLPGLARAAITAEIERVPWSGYWWSFRSGGLATGMGYAGHPAPLEKYDLAVTGAYPGPATAYGLGAYYKKNAVSWAGLCYSWAAAALLEREPSRGGIYNDVPFYVGDKKGLLTAAYDRSFEKSIRVSIGTPLEFHQALENYIAVEKTGIIMDLGAEGQVWNYPVFRYDMTWTGAGTRRTYLVTIHYATDDVYPDYVGSRIQTRTFSYYFDLEGSVVRGSEWIVKPPCDVAYEPVRDCGTGLLDYGIIRRIADGYDDRFEPNDTFQSAFITSGGRLHLLASDDDYFRMILRAGDSLVTLFSADEPSIEAEVYDSRRRLLETLRKGERQEFVIGETGNYYIRVTPAEKPSYYDENVAYEKDGVLYLEQRLPSQSLFPLHPYGSWATGLAFGNPDASLGRVIVSRVGLLGLAEETFLLDVPERKAAGVVESTFGLEPAFGARQYLKVFSDLPLQGLAVSTSPTSLIGGNLVRGESLGREIFYPHVSRGAVATRIGLMNGGDETETVDLMSYDESGVMTASMSLTLGPGEKQEWDSRYLGAFPSGARTLVATSRSGRSVLTGYLHFSSENFSDLRDGALVTLQDEGSPLILAPHVACNGYWNTFMALMNRGAAEAAVVLSARDAAGELLESRTVDLPGFGSLCGDVAALFPSLNPERIASVAAESEDEPLSGLLFYHSRDWRQFAAMELQAPGTSPLSLSHVASSALWGTGLGVMNAGGSEETVAFSLLDALGRPVREATRVLPPGGRVAVTLAALFGEPLPPSGVMARIDGTGLNPLAGIYLIATADRTKLVGDVLEALPPAGP